MHILNRHLGFERVPLAVVGASVVALLPATAAAMDPFIDSLALLNNQDAHSGAPMAVADMNADGLDDIVRLDALRYLEIEYQQPDGSFELGETIDTMMFAWGMSIADLDGNGYNDVFAGDANSHKDIFLANDDGTGFVQQDVGGTGIFVQCSSFADINNDGHLDMFICADTSKSLVLHGDGTGALTQTYETLDPVSTVPSDNSGNYGNVWSDFDLDGDIDLYISKCRQGIADPDDGRRLNSLFRNNGDGTYSEVAEDVGLLPRGQTWASDFADIDNDGDMDAIVINHLDFGEDVPSQLYANDGTGNFTAITAEAGVEQAFTDVGEGIQVLFADFDNDAYVDILLSSGDETHQILFNDGDGTFTVDNSVLDFGNLSIQSFATGDLNDDGSLDIVAGFGSGFNAPSTTNPDRLLLNPANDGNNWLKVHLTGVESNRSAVGAVVQITGSWGTQTREIRAGESYGINHSLIEHFGLAQDETVDLSVTWPSGSSLTLEDVGGNQTLDIAECDDVYFADEDGDGFGDPDSGEFACEAPEGRVQDNTDCDDDDGNSFPGNAETCDRADNDCNGEIDEGLAMCGDGSSSGGDETGDTTGGIDPTDGTTTGPIDPTAAGSDTGTGTDTDDSAGQGGGGGGGCAISTPSTDAVLLLMLLGFGTPLVRRRERC